MLLTFGQSTDPCSMPWEMTRSHLALP